MEGDLYDEFGNYIGPEIQDSDESGEEDDKEDQRDEVIVYLYDNNLIIF